MSIKAYLRTRSSKCGSAKPSEAGSTLITVMMIGATLSVVSTVLITNTMFNVDRSAKSVNVAGALQAAEAGLNDYLAKMSDDRTYWNHWVHEAETTRTDGTTGSNGSWTDTGAAGWGYVTPKDNWKAVGNDFEYNLQVTPPSGSVTTARIVATGRAVDTTTGLKAVEAIVSPASVTSIVLLADSDLSLDDSTTVTTGGVYTTDASSGTNDLCHDGTANSNLYAEDRYITNGSCNGHSGAGIAYDGDGSTPYADIRSQFPSPITFGSLLPSLDQITIAAGASGGIYRTNTGGCDSSSNYYEVTFNANATVTIVKHWTDIQFLIFCSKSSSSTETIAMPTTGAIYLDKSVDMKTSVVDGRVSLYSGGSVSLVGNITYEVPGDDILGLVAQNNLDINGDRTVNAALFARTGTFTASSSSDSLFLTGQLIVKSGSGNLFDNYSTYTWDTNLDLIQPPFFPSVGEKLYELKTIREVNPTL